MLRAQQRAERRARHEATERQAAASGRAHAAAERAGTRQAALLRASAQAIATMRYGAREPAATCARLADALRAFVGAEAVVIFGATHAAAAARGPPAGAQIGLEPVHSDLAP